MKLFHIATGAALLCLAAGTAHAQLALNEIYASHTGTDTEEFIELTGTPGTLLDDIMVLVVEGECPACGTLDRAWDLTGLTIPASGYFVLGNTTVTPNDFDLGASNSIENGAETFYLVDAGSPAGVAALLAQLGTDVSVPPASMSAVTSIPTTVAANGGSVLDLVAMAGTNLTEVYHDGATVVGPDLAGPFFPAGIFRDQNAPNPWCTMDWLDFTPGGPLRPQTPGATNCACDGTACAGSLATPFCDASDGAHASCPCGPGNPDAGCEIAQGTGGVRAEVTGLDTGLSMATLTGTGFPPAAAPTAIVIRANNLEATPVQFGDGLRCIGITGFVRLAATNASSGTSIHTFTHAAGPGVFNYQIWFRNTPVSYCVTTGPSSGAFNLTNGQAITW
jgi:hypothetical protein